MDRRELNILFNAEPSEVFSHDKKKIVFVHVGKCAGESIIHAFRQKFSDDFVMFEMHCYDANQRIRQIVQARRPDVYYIISKRDPVSRFVSSFNWDKHNLFLRGTLNGTRFADFFQRFQNVNSLVTSLKFKESSDFSAAVEFSNFGHMGMGQSWYTPLDVVGELPKDRTWCIDIETLRDDLVSAMSALGCASINSDWEPPRLKSDYSDGYENAGELFPRYLSQDNREFLLKYLSVDNEIYRKLSELNC